MNLNPYAAPSSRTDSNGTRTTHGRLAAILVLSVSCICVMHHFANLRTPSFDWYFSFASVALAPFALLSMEAAIGYQKLAPHPTIPLPIRVRLNRDNDFQPSPLTTFSLVPRLCLGTRKNYIAGCSQSQRDGSR